MKHMYCGYSNEKGVTLTALLITIVILLILALVAMNSIQNDGLIQKVEYATDEHNLSARNETIGLDEYSAFIEFFENYTLLDYLESDGKQCINTEVAVTEDTKIETTIAILHCTAINNPGYEDVQIQSQDYNLFGSYGNKTGLALGIYAGKLRWWNVAPQTQVFEYEVGRKYKIVMNDNGVYSVDGVEQTLKNTTVTACDNSIYLFGAQYTGSPGSAFKSGAVRIYNFKIYVGTELVRSFIPCYSKIEEKKGMYDLVNRKFYKNLTENDFV